MRLSEQITDLKIELARRDAEVQYLENQLAQASAASKPAERHAARNDEVDLIANPDMHPVGMHHGMQ